MYRNISRLRWSNKQINDTNKPLNLQQFNLEWHENHLIINNKIYFANQIVLKIDRILCPVAKLNGCGTD